MICISLSWKTYLFLWRSKKLQRELTFINIVTLPCHIWRTFLSWCSRAAMGDSKTGELAVLQKKCPDFSAHVHPFLHLWYIWFIYRWMRFEVSYLYIQPKCNYLVYVGSYCNWKTEQFYQIRKSLTLWHGAKYISAFKWLCF